MSGAEKLLGAGDMLYLSGEMSKPTRIQSAYISEEELKRTVKFLINTYQDEVPEEIDISSADQDKNPLFDSLTNSRDEDEGDSLYEEARETIITNDKASTSFLQRKLRIGYARAARIMDMLEEDGIIGPADGSKPREILINEADTQEKEEEVEENGEYLKDEEEEENEEEEKEVKHE